MTSYNELKKQIILAFKPTLDMSPQLTGKR